VIGAQLASLQESGPLGHFSYQLYATSKPPDSPGPIGLGIGGRKEVYFAETHLHDPIGIGWIATKAQNTALPNCVLRAF
jgi:hypothetical protein